MWCSSSHSRTAVILSSIPCRASIRSLAARALTTGLVSLEMITIGTPDSRSRWMPSPSARLTRTDSRPSWSTPARSSVCTPSKSVITTSTSISAAGGSITVASALATIRSSSVSMSTAVEESTATGAIRPKKRCWCWRKPATAHHIEGTGLAVVGPPVLAARTEGGLVVLTVDQGQLVVGDTAPQELMGGQCGEAGVGLAVADQADTVVEGDWIDERAGALDEDQHVRVQADQVELVQPVQQRRLGGSGVAGQRDGADDRLGTGHLGGVGDVGVVGADEDPVDVPGRQAGADRTFDQRHAAHPAQVLARHSLGATAGRDDRDRGHQQATAASPCRLRAVRET